MTCLEAQGMITPFINDELMSEKLEGFLNHIDQCPECKDELEVYYILLTGMKQLDEDKNLSSNFHLALINKLKKAEEKIIKTKIHYIRKRIILMIIICVITVLSSVRIGEYVVEDVIPDMEETTIKESNFKLKYNFFENKDRMIDAYILNNMDKLLEYKLQKENEKLPVVKPQGIPEGEQQNEQKDSTD